jgi:glucose-6-phosphate isomerase
VTGTLSVHIADSTLRQQAGELAAALARDRVASRLTAADQTLWGESIAPSAARSLAWAAPFDRGRLVLADAARLGEQVWQDGLDRVVVLGMGGSALAAEVVAADRAAPVTVLDTIDPGRVCAVLAGDLSRTLVVVSSKSGITQETDALRRVFEDAFVIRGLPLRRHWAAITDDGSALARHATEAGYRHVFSCVPEVGGRYSALTAFGLVPAALAARDTTEALHDGHATAAILAADEPDNPALLLAAALGVSHTRGRHTVAFASESGVLNGFGNWVEQLVAESTGKEGIGLLPVVAEDTGAPGLGDPDVLAVVHGASDTAADIRIEGPLGGLFLLWQYATALVGRILRIDPFDQPDVESTKAATRRLLDAGTTHSPSSVRRLDTTSPSSAAALEQLRKDAAGEGGYLAIQAYLDPVVDGDVARLRGALVTPGLPVTFGWAPRFLHSTGQFHKGGRQNGAFLQLTADPITDVPVPGRSYTLGALQRAQALADGGLLAALGRPVLRLHLAERASGCTDLIRLVGLD